MSEQSPERIAEKDVPEDAISMAEWEKYDLAEVVNGAIVTMSPPKAQHVIVMTHLFTSIYDFLKENPLGRVFPDSMPYVLEGDERGDWVRGSRVPDVSFVSSQKLKEHAAQFGGEYSYFHFAPDLAAEIVSEHDRYKDIVDKIGDYLKYGTQLVWIVDPFHETIKVYSQDNPDGLTLHATDILTGDPVLPGWRMAVAAILDTKLTSVD